MRQLGSLIRMLDADTWLVFGLDRYGGMRLINMSVYSGRMSFYSNVYFRYSEKSFISPDKRLVFTIPPVSLFLIDD